MAKTRRIDELREKLDSELTFEAEELNRELFDLRFKSSAEARLIPGGFMSFGETLPASRLF